MKFWGVKKDDESIDITAVSNQLQDSHFHTLFNSLNKISTTTFPFPKTPTSLPNHTS